MISKPEYLAHSKTLDSIAKKYESTASQQLVQTVDVANALKITRGLTKQYQDEFQELLSTALAETGTVTIDHFDRQLGLKLSDADKQEIVTKAILRQLNERYYGMNLDERLKASALSAETRIIQSSSVGAKPETRIQNLVRVFAQAYPFGSHKEHDRRIMLGQLIKLEHDIARDLAKKADIVIVKWALSEKHRQVDICDDYAAHIDTAVVAYLHSNSINIDAHGCYFIEEVPLPPHPNCQCVLRLLKDGRLTTEKPQRGRDRLRDLLDRLWRRRKKLT